MTVATVSRFMEFSRAQWAALRSSTPLPLTESQLRGLVGLNEWMSLDEVADIYLPLSRLLNLYVGAVQNLHRATATFVGEVKSTGSTFQAATSHSVSAMASDTMRIARLIHWRRCLRAAAARSARA